MSDATGDQAPPNPIVDYSDFVAVAFLEAPLARDDAEQVEVIGTSGSPVAFATSPTVTSQAAPGTDMRDYESCNYWVYITTPGTGAVLSVFATAAGVDSAATSDHGILRSEDQIAAGVAPQAIYQMDFDMTTAAPYGPINIPKRGRRHRLSVSTDTGDVLGYVSAQRIA
jgi:hypothetical protein